MKGLRLSSVRVAVAIMGAALLLPFFRMGGAGCAQSKSFPCESVQVKSAAAGLLTEWVEKHGKFYDLVVVPFRCPDSSDLNNGRLVAPFSRRGSTACADFNYWASRRDDKAGWALHQKLAEEFESKEPVGFTDDIRMPGQPEAQLEVECTHDIEGRTFDCAITARLFLVPTPLDDGHAAASGGGAEPPTADGAVDATGDDAKSRKPAATKHTTVAFTLPADPSTESLSEPGHWGDALGPLVSDEPGPMALIRGGLAIDDAPYLLFLVLTVILGLFGWRGRWPRATVIVSAVALLVSGALIVSGVVDSISYCRGYFAYAPQNRAVAFLESLFVDVKLGLLVFLLASAAAASSAVRSWLRQRAPVPVDEG